MRNIRRSVALALAAIMMMAMNMVSFCLLYTSDAADE